MARICLVVTNGCAPDPRVERHARWLVECGHEVTIFAGDREHTLDALSERDGYTILRTRTVKQGHQRVLSVKRRGFFDH